MLKNLVKNPIFCGFDLDLIVNLLVLASQTRETHQILQGMYFN